MDDKKVQAKDHEHLAGNKRLQGKNFEWDEEKNRVNIKKHGVSFVEAMTVFDDDDALYKLDTEHSIDEDRFIILGISTKLKLLVVCHCYRAGDDIIRIISARKATKPESEQYGGAVL